MNARPAAATSRAAAPARRSSATPEATNRKAATRFPTVVEVAAIAFVKIVVGTIVLLLGFSAVSDDDFARVVIAQGFAGAPRLDPSGTSWLPLPFWVNGAAMMLAGRSFEVARLVAIALGVVSCLLVRVAARWLGASRGAAFGAAILVAVWPTTARLGVATVPELPAAALSLVAIASVATDDIRRRMLGALAIAAACLCRYEPWFVATGVVVFNLHDARRPGRAPLLGAAALALAAPVLWCAWNAHAHDGPFHFVDRVSRYKEAIDQGALGGRVFAYVTGFLRLEPEWLAVTAFFVVRYWRHRVLAPAWFARFRRPVTFMGVLFVLLTISSVKGGAPTHHAERALAVVLLFAAVVLAQGAAFSFVHRGRLPDPTLPIVALALIAVALAYPARRWVLKTDSFARRESELAAGRLGASLPSGCVVLDVIDYGHFAVEAGSGAPERWVRAREPVPGRVLVPSSIDALLNLARERRCVAALARVEALAQGVPTRVVAESSPWVLITEAP